LAVVQDIGKKEVVKLSKIEISPLDTNEKNRKGG
jgi:hypothetical protein